MKYLFKKIEPKWQAKCEEAKVFEAKDNSDNPKFYGLVEFPSADGDELAAYTQFISRLCDMARDAKRVSSKPTETDNDKYAFRCFLLRLGFIGKEYKTARKILLRNLTGNSASRYGE